MVVSAVFSSVDVALWLSEQASADEVNLDPERMHALLFIAQMIYAERHQGERLMPANFVVYKKTPVEVNVLRVFEVGHPVLGRARVKPDLVPFLEEIWHYHARAILEKIKQALECNPVYVAITEREEGQHILFEDMQAIAAEEFRSRLVEDEMTKARPMSSHGERLPDGRVVQSWSPRVVSRESVYKIETIHRK